MKLVKASSSVLVLGIILVVATGVRFYRLGDIPRGLYMDEAADANDALGAIAQHRFSVFYTGDGGREGLWIAMQSLSLRAFGRSIFAVRFWAPLVGVVTVLAIFALGQIWFGRRAGLVAAWLTATSFWHVLFSRVSFRGILVPLLLVGSILFLQAAWNARGRRWILYSLIGGLLYGLGFYSYIAFRITPLLLAVLFVVEWQRSNPWEFKTKSTRCGLWAATATLTTLPLAIYFTAHFRDFSNRTNEVAIWNSAKPLMLLGLNTVRELWMFIGKGDANWRQNLRPMPELLYPVSMLLLVGVIVICRRRITSEERARGIVVLAWLAIMLLPAILTKDAVPHALRSIGALPAAVLLAAAGAEWMFRQMSGRRVLVSLFVLVLLVAGATDVARYFTIWASSPEVAYAYQLPQTQLAASLLRLPPSVKVLIVVEEPTDYDWRLHAYRLVNPNGQSVLLPLQAQIPLFMVGERANFTYLPSGSATSRTLTDLFGCIDAQFNPLSLPPDTLVMDKSCGGVLLARLSPRDRGAPSK